jgi:flagellar motor switch protein FliM
MAADRLLSDLDGPLKYGAIEEDASKKVQSYDFRPDRIAKDQLRAIHLPHENFARSLASSLSAYLCANVAVNLVGVEQLSFVEFAGCLPSPTSIVTLGMKRSTAARCWRSTLPSYFRFWRCC